MSSPEGDHEFAASARPLVVIDAQRRVVDANDTALETLSVSHDEVVRMRIASPERFSRPDDAAPSGAPLSKREREILSRVARGQDGPEIASELVVSPATVRTHIGNAIRKLGARSRAHAVAIALRSGLLDDGQLDRR